MAISKDLILRAARAVAEAEGLHMDANALLEDIVLLAYAFPEEEDFEAACANTKRAIALLVDGTVSSSELKYSFSGWRSYHYQHKVGQGFKATCRIVFRPIDGGIEVKGFGHRRIPQDFYERMSAQRG